jgi:hypothetical protein
MEEEKEEGRKGVGERQSGRKGEQKRGRDRGGTRWRKRRGQGRMGMPLGLSEPWLLL